MSYAYRHSFSQVNASELFIAASMGPKGDYS